MVAGEERKVQETPPVEWLVHNSAHSNCRATGIAAEYLLKLEIIVPSDVCWLTIEESWMKHSHANAFAFVAQTSLISDEL